MAGVHVLVGLVEGIVTAAVLGYLQKVRPDIVAKICCPVKHDGAKKRYWRRFAIATVITGAGLSLLASEFPEGLNGRISNGRISRISGHRAQ